MYSNQYAYLFSGPRGLSHGTNPSKLRNSPESCVTGLVSASWRKFVKAEKQKLRRSNIQRVSVGNTVMDRYFFPAKSSQFENVHQNTSNFKFHEKSCLVSVSYSICGLGTENHGPAVTCDCYSSRNVKFGPSYPLFGSLFMWHPQNCGGGMYHLGIECSPGMTRVLV